MVSLYVSRYYDEDINLKINQKSIEIQSMNQGTEAADAGRTPAAAVTARLSQHHARGAHHRRSGWP